MDGGICRYGRGDALCPEFYQRIICEKIITKILILLSFYAKRLKSETPFGIIKIDMDFHIHGKEGIV